MDDHCARRPKNIIFLRKKQTNNTFFFCFGLSSSSSSTLKKSEFLVWFSFGADGGRLVVRRRDRRENGLCSSLPLPIDWWIYRPLERLLFRPYRRAFCFFLFLLFRIGNCATRRNICVFLLFSFCLSSSFIFEIFLLSRERETDEEEGARTAHRKLYIQQKLVNSF